MTNGEQGMTYGQYLDGIARARQAGPWWYGPARIATTATISAALHLLVRRSSRKK